MQQHLKSELRDVVSEFDAPSSSTAPVDPVPMLPPKDGRRPTTSASPAADAPAIPPAEPATPEPGTPATRCARPILPDPPRAHPQSDAIPTAG